MLLTHTSGLALTQTINKMYKNCDITHRCVGVDSINKQTVVKKKIKKIEKNKNCVVTSRTGVLVLTQKIK